MTSRPTRRCSTRAACTRSSSGTTPATRRRWWSGYAGCLPSSSSRSPRRGRRTPAASAPRRWCTASGWTQHSVGAQYIRAGAIIQLLLGNIGRPGGGVHRAARARQHPGVDRRADAVRPAARLPARCRRRATPRWPDYLDRITGDEPERLLAQRRYVHGLAAQGVLGRERHRGERLLLRLPAADQRRPRHVPHGDGHGRRQGVRLLPAGAEPGGRLGARAAAAPRHGQPRLAGGARPRRDRERDVLEGRPGDRDGRDRAGDLPHRGVPVPGRIACGEGGHVHADAADVAVAREGGRTAGRRPLGAVVLLPPGPHPAGEAGRLDRRAGPAAARPVVGLRRWRATSRRARTCCGASAAST